MKRTSLLLCLAALVAVLPTGAASAAPHLSISMANLSHDQPVLVSTDPAVPRAVGVEVFTSAPAAHVVVTPSDPGLSFTPASIDLGDLSAGQLHELRFEVVATEAGLHQPTFTVTSDDQPSDSTGLDFVLAPGDHAHLAPRDSLTFLHGFSWTGKTSDADGTHRVTRMLTFVDARWAYLGLPRAGVPACRRALHPWTATQGCVRYAYDARTHRAQVGGIAALLETRGAPGWFYTDGFVATRFDHTPGHPYGFLGFGPLERLRFPSLGTRLSGQWVFVDHHRDRAGVVTARLRFGPDRHYRLSVRDTVTGLTTTSGRYRVAGRAHLVLQHGRHRDSHTIAFSRDANGDGRLWLTVRGTGQRAPRDAVLMRPRG